MIGLAIFVLAIVVMNVLTGNRNTPQEILYSEFLQRVSAGDVMSVVIAGQRIEARNDDSRKKLGYRVQDGKIKTACQQACPTEAIVFGDLNGRNKDDTENSQSEVAKLQALPRAYGMLSELNVRPRLLFLARVRNPHPKLKQREEKNGHGGNHNG